MAFPSRVLCRRDNKRYILRVHERLCAGQCGYVRITHHMQTGLLLKQ